MIVVAISLVIAAGGHRRLREQGELSARSQAVHPLFVSPTARDADGYR